MITRLNDTMALVREFGGGDLLVTITCNQFWPYIVVFQYDKFNVKVHCSRSYSPRVVHL